MGFFQRVKVMLGLADEYEDDQFDDEYDEGFEEEEEPEYTPSRTYASPYGTEPASVRRVSREPDLARARQVASLRAVAPAPVEAPQVKIYTVEPKSYAEAQSIADKFKAGQPVIMNLAMTDPDLGKRLLDFAAGLTYALDGGIQKVSERVFMLTPRNVDVSANERARTRGSNLFGE